MYFRPGHQKPTDKNQSASQAERPVVFESATFCFFDVVFQKWNLFKANKSLNYYITKQFQQLTSL